MGAWAILGLGFDHDQFAVAVKYGGSPKFAGLPTLEQSRQGNGRSGLAHRAATGAEKRRAAAPIIWMKTSRVNRGDAGQRVRKCAMDSPSTACARP